MLEEYIRRGWIDEQLVKSRALYRGKCETAARRRSSAHMPAGVEWTRADGRVLLLADDPRLRRDRARRDALPRPASGSSPGALFYADGRGGENVRLSFSMVDEALIDEGVERLASLLAA